MNRTVLKDFTILCLLSTTLLIGCKVSVSASPTTIYVPADYPTIQEAINHANEGDMVFVRNGTYYENVVVNKTVSVAGEDKATTIIDGGGNGVVVSLEANNSNFSNFTIMNSGNSDYDCGVSLNSSGNNLRANIVTGNQNGILVNPGCVDNTVTENTVSMNKVYGIHLWYSNGSILNGNTVTNGYDGIIIEFCCNTTLGNNTISGNVWNFGVGGEGLPFFINDIDTSNTVEGKPIRYLINQQNIVVDATWAVGYLCLVNSTNVTVKDLALNTPSWHGVLFAYTNDSRIENVKVSGTSYAIDFVDSFDNTVANNSILNRNGISLTNSNDNTIIGNSISEDDFAVLLLSSSNNTVISNDINNNWRGLFLYSSNNRICHNNFTDNAVQVFTNINAYKNTWDNGYPSGGNYWSDYAGVDKHYGPGQDIPGSDGIGDTPYYIDSINRDNYPLMSPYLTDHLSIRVLYFDLLQEYSGLSTNYSSLMTNYIDLQSRFAALQGDYTSLQTNLTSLDRNYSSLISRYNTLQANLTSLNSSYNDLKKNYDSMNSSYTNLNTAFNDYKNSKQGELNYTRDLAYALTTITVILIVATVYIIMRKPKQRP
jgi:parallel beta-helix repeat protein